MLITNTYVIYLFSVKKIRHREILNFTFSSIEHTMAAEAILHVYVYGDEYLRPHELSSRTFNISVHRVVKTASQPDNILLLTEAEHRFEVPHGEGHFIQINVTKLAQEWFVHPFNNHGLILKMDSLGRKVVVIDSTTHIGVRDYNVIL